MGRSDAQVTASGNGGPAIPVMDRPSADASGRVGLLARRGVRGGAAMVAIVALAGTSGWLFYTRAQTAGELSDARREVTAAKERIHHLAGEVGDLTDEKDRLADSNGNLSHALSGCQQAFDIMERNPRPTPDAVRTFRQGLDACFAVEPTRTTAL